MKIFSPDAAADGTFKQVTFWRIADIFTNYYNFMLAEPECKRCGGTMLILSYFLSLPEEEDT